MTHQALILKDLRAGRATAKALAERIPIAPASIERILERMEVEGDVIATHIAETVRVYSLAEKLKTP
jgi:DNA-binding HxlR family transcriptional regulator